MKIRILFMVSMIGLSSFAQSYQLDPNFQPFFDIRTQNSPYLGTLIELPSGNIIFGGSFDIVYSNPTVTNTNIGSVTRSGGRNYNFSSTFSQGGVVDFYNDSLLINGDGDYTLKDTNGNVWNWNWRLNYAKTVKCRTGRFYVYKDGSTLFGNRGGGNGQACPIINPPDTFPGRHIVKVNPQGLWDSTFIGVANAAPRGFLPYDSNRLLVYGNPFQLTHYNGVQIDGLFRIYLDGTLDTTFSSPMSTVVASNFFNPHLVESSGKFFLSGSFLLKGQTQYHTLVRLNPDGSLDPTFMNFSGPIDTNNFFSGTAPIAPTDDGGYLVGGTFNSYQGFPRPGIAKIDSSGAVDPAYFNTGGPDSSIALGLGYPEIYFIHKSKFGGYYVGGDFLKWDGQPSQPLVRLNGLVTGVEEAPFGSAQGASVAVYPNPSNGIFTVKSEVGIKGVEVYDLMGSLVLERSSSVFEGASRYDVANATSLDDPSKKYRDALSAGDAPSWNLTNFEPGIYLLKVVLENGEVITKKLIKQ
jgi:hypothetical protein